MFRPPDSRIRITNNPNYTFPEDATTLAEVTCFDNPNHIQLPSSTVPATVGPSAASGDGISDGGAVVSTFDSATYNKRERPRST